MIGTAPDDPSTDPTPRSVDLKGVECKFFMGVDGVCRVSLICASIQFVTEYYINLYLINW